MGDCKTKEAIRTWKTAGLVMGICILKVVTLPVVMMRPSGMFDVGIGMSLHLDIENVNLSRG
jgi:hypothetical protein